uniref:Decapping nuclease n=1 Tax=Tetraselmis sp. GSL018 TaxID=582737 RepID=A0A061REV9_9CHLO
MSTLVSLLEPTREAGQASSRLSQPKEISFFSKSRKGVSFDRSGLNTYKKPELPVDLNVGFSLFQDRDRTNPYPAPLANILRSLEEHGQDEILREATFVTYRGNIAKLLLVPYNDREEWHMEAERQGETIFLNVVEAPSSLERQARDGNNPSRRAMQYWGFAFEEACNAGGAGLQVGVDSTEGFNSVSLTSIGEHQLVIASEVDCQRGPTSSSGTGGYIELKTTRLMESQKQVDSFERHKLSKWWAQSYPAGVPTIVVGFRDDDGFVQKLQELETAKLPKYVAGKRFAWDAGVCLSFLNRSLAWLRGALAAEPEGSRFRLEHSPSRGCRAIRLVRDPSIPPFVPEGVSRLYSCAGAAVLQPEEGDGGGARGDEAAEPSAKKARLLQ